MRAPGTEVPNVIAVGTRRGSFAKDFAAVHGKCPAGAVELEGAAFERLSVSSDDAATLAETLRRTVAKNEASARLRPRPRVGGS